MEGIVNEEWRPVKDFENCYEVSNLGRVKSLERYVPHKATGTQRINERILKPKVATKSRYRSVQLYVGDGLYSKKWKYVHRLVLEAFAAPPQPGQTEVNHKDGDKGNNSVSNLEWVSPKENSQHSAASGLIAFGDRHGTAKLTEDQVREIASRLKREPNWKLGREFGVSPGTVRAIATGRRWSRTTGITERVSRSYCPIRPRLIGEDNPNTKLTAAQVREVVSLFGKERYRTIAARYGVSIPVIEAIHSGRRWSHVTGIRPKCQEAAQCTA